MSQDTAITDEGDSPWKINMKVFYGKEVLKERRIPFPGRVAPDFVCPKCNEVVPRRRIPFHECLEDRLSLKLQNVCGKCGKTFEKERGLRTHQNWCQAPRHMKKRWVYHSSFKHKGLHLVITDKRRASWKIFSQNLKGIKRSQESRDKHSKTKKALFASGKLVPWNKGHKTETWNARQLKSEASLAMSSLVSVTDPAR